MGLYYNKDIVKQELDKFKKENEDKNLSPEVLAKKEADLICREAVYAVYTAYHAKFPKDGKSAEDYGKELRAESKNGVARAVSYFVDKMRSPDREKYLERFQTLAAADETGDFLSHFEKDAYHLLVNANEDMTNNHTQKGDEYVKGLFAPVADGKDIPCDDVKENEYVTQELLRQRQKETEETVIDVPEGMDESIVIYTVMGEFFKPETMETIEDALYANQKGALPADFSAAENAIGTFFENTVIDDNRPNMQAHRLAVPQARKAAKELLSSGNRQAIQENLKKAFDVFYEQAATMTDTGKVRYAFAVRHADRLIKSAVKCGFELNAMGITEEKLDMLNAMRKVVDFRTETEKLRHTLQKKAQEFYFSGYAPEKDFINDPETQEQMVELAAREDMLKAHTQSIIALRNLGDSVSGSEGGAAELLGRKPLSTERRFLEDEEAMLREAKEYITGAKTKADFDTAAKTPAGRMNLMASGIPVESRHSNKIPVSLFLERGQQKLLDNFEGYAAGRHGAEKISEAVQNIRKLSAGLKPECSWVEREPLIAAYQALNEAAEAYRNTIPNNEVMSNSDNLRFATMSAGISELIEMFENAPDRAAAHAQLNKLRELKYDHAIVQRELDQFRKQEQAPGADAVLSKEKELICREAVFRTVAEHHTRHNTDGMSADKFEETLRRGKNVAAEKAVSYFSLYSPSSNLVYNLERFQTMADADKAGSFLKVFSTDAHDSLQNAAKDHVGYFTVQGDEYVKGLFAPKTQGDGMIFDGIEENETVTVKALRDAQTQIDAVTIDVPEGMNENLVTYAVMGEFLKPENLIDAKEALASEGSTLRDEFSVATNAIATFFSNTITDETRGNMHGYRLIIPQVRKSAKSIIEGKDPAKIDENLKNAFDTLYSKATAIFGTYHCQYAFAVRHAIKLAEEAKACGRNLEALGITDKKLEQLRIMQKVVDFRTETERMRSTLCAKADTFYFSGYAPEHDELMKPEAQELLLNIAAREDVIKAIETELLSLHKTYEIKADPNTADTSMSGRSATTLEKRLFEDEDGLVQESMKYVKSGEPMSELRSRMETPEGRLRLLGISIPVENRYRDRIPLPFFAAEAQEAFLNKIENYLTGKAGTEKALEALHAVRTAAANVKPDSSWEEYDKLIAPYKALYKATDAFQKTIPTKQKLDDEANRNFLIASEQVKEVVQALEENPQKQKAQEEHERSRAEFLDRHKNEKLKYDGDKVAERLEAYKKAHPDADTNKINKAEIDIVAEEIMIYSRLEAFERCTPDGRNMQKFRQLEQEIRNGGTAFEDERKILSFLDDKEKLRFATAYQKNMEKLTDAAGYNGLGICINRLSESNPAVGRGEVENAREDVFTALFAPKTEHGGIRMDGFEQQGKTTPKEVLDWQKQADDIEIPVRRGRDSSLVKFMVLGRTMQDDLLLKASERVLEHGSTLPGTHSSETNASVSFWDNIMFNDPRVNVNGIRSVVPEARQDVKDMIQNNDVAGMNKCLKTAFDSMYNEFIRHQNRNSHTWYVPMQQMGRFLSALERNGISAQSLGIEREKLEKYAQMKPTLDKVRELSEVNTEIKETLFRYFESGFSEEYGLKGNGKLHSLIEKRAGLEYGLATMYNELSSFKDAYAGMKQADQDVVMQARDLMPKEKMCGESPKAFDELMGRKAKSAVNKQMSKAADTHEGVFSFCTGKIGENPPVRRNQTFMEKIAVIPELEKTQDLLNMPIFDELNNVDEVRQQLAELIAFRKDNDKDYTLERLESFIEPYEEMGNAMKEMMKDMPHSIEQSKDGAMLVMAQGGFELHVRYIREEAERIRAEQADEQELAEIKGGTLPGFVERYKAYSDKLEELGKISEREKEFNAILGKMKKLNLKLGALCADSNTLLTRSDAQGVKNLFTSALKSTTAYINGQNKSALEDDRVFMATEIQDLLADNLSLFDELNQTKAISMTEAVRDAYAKPRNAENTNARFGALADRLDVISFRFGGNSTEFKNMKTALDAVKKNGATEENVKLLEESTQAYLTAKKIVPYSKKGKARLQIARQLRELCTELRMASEWAYSGFRKPDNRSFEEKLVDRLKTKETAALEEMKLAYHTQNNEQYKAKLAEVIYLHGAEKKLQKAGEKYAEKLTEAEMEQGIADCADTAEGFMKSGLSGELHKALISPDAGENIEKLYNTYMNDAVLNNSGKNKSGGVADRANDIITKKRPTLSF